MDSKRSLRVAKFRRRNSTKYGGVFDELDSKLIYSGNTRELFIKLLGEMAAKHLDKPLIGLRYKSIISAPRSTEFIKMFSNEKNNKEGSDGRTDQEELPKQI